MRISDLRIFEEQDYIGEFNLNRNERDLVCKALILSRGNVIDAAISLRVVDRKVYSAIFQHSLQDFLERVRSGEIVISQNIENMIRPSRTKELTHN